MIWECYCLYSMTPAEDIPKEIVKKKKKLLRNKMQHAPSEKLFCV